MKISYNWLKDYIKTDLSPEQIAEILTATGLEVEGLELHESIPGGLKGVVTGEVLSCEKHPDADKLSATTVNIGNEILSIVCGAPNVRTGQKVLVATVGTDLPDGSGGTFTIKKTKIRGVPSEGMICAEDELGIGDNHDGILILPEDTAIGQSAQKILNLYKDYIFEIGLTPNRSDANGHIGVARDIMAVLKIHHEKQVAIQYPNLSDISFTNSPPPISVEVLDPKACPRYCGITLRNIKVGPSPQWLKERLEAIGQRPINNVVDITNYILHEYGQPLHAFDADQISGNAIVVSKLQEGTTFVTLDEVKRTLTNDDLMICDANKNPLCMAGVFGGMESGVTDNTTSIFLESAHFSATGIRRTSTRFQLRTDAARCYEKGTDPNICKDALKRAVLLLQDLAGATVDGDIVDVYPNPIENAQINFTANFFNKHTGLNLSERKIIDILEALEMSVQPDNDQLLVSVPTNKPDVTRPADLVEEILRIFGLDNVPISEKFAFSAGIQMRPDSNDLKNRVSDFLSDRGFNEMMAMSITQSGYFVDAMPIEKDRLVFINNTSNIHLDVMRPDLLISGLEAAAYNLNRRQSRLQLFEFGSAYINNGGIYEETESLCILISGDKAEQEWRYGQPSKNDFFDIKGIVEALFTRLGLSSWQTEEINDHRFSYGMRYFRGPIDIVSFGKVQGNIRKELGIKQDIYAAVFNWQQLFKAVRKNKVIVSEISKFPEVSRDLAIILSKDAKFSEVEQVAIKTEKKLLSSIRLFDVYENESQLGKDKKSYAVNFTLSSSEKTLSDKDIDSVMDRLIQAFESQLSATIRK